MLFGAGLVASLGLGHVEDTADLVILNGNVYTADGKGTFQEAVAVRGNKILRVGSNTEISALRGPKMQVIDAQGGAVTPSLKDIHRTYSQADLRLTTSSLPAPSMSTAIRSYPLPSADYSRFLPTSTSRFFRKSGPAAALPFRFVAAGALSEEDFRACL